MMSVYEAADMAGDGPKCGACPSLLFEAEVLERRMVCRRCEQRVLGLLGDVEALWRLLPDRLEKGSVPDGAGRGGSTGSAAPGNLGAISLLAGGVVERLIVWEDDWRRTLRWDPAPPRGRQDEQLRGIVRFLRDHLPWAVCADGDAVEGLLTDLRRLVGEMRAVVDPGPSTRVRTELACPEPVGSETADDGVQEVEVCGGRLIFDKPRLEIRCEACGTRVPRQKWAELGITLGTLPMPAAA